MQRRVLRRTTALAAALTIAGLTSAAGAQQGLGGWGGSQQPGRQPGMRQMGQERPGQSRMTSLSGTISEIKEISINGREPHLFAKLDDESGQEFTINLGPVDEVADRVSEGDQIEARTVKVPILGHDVYHVVVLRTDDGQTMRVRQIQDPEIRAAMRERIGERLSERWQQRQSLGQGGGRQGEQAGAAGGRMTSIRGTVSETKEVSIGGREPYLFAKVEDDNGQQRIVNLGPSDDVADKVSEGDEIEVRAINVPMLDRNIYHAVALRTDDGERVRVRQIQDPEIRAALRERVRERLASQRFQTTGFRQPGSDQDASRELGLNAPDTGRMTSIQGNISELKKVALDDKEPYVVATVEDDSGKERTVNLGPADEVVGLVNEGDDIEVWAVRLPVFGRDVYHALMVNANGQTQRIHQIRDPEVRAALRQRVRERWQEQQREHAPGQQFRQYQ